MGHSNRFAHLSDDQLRESIYLCEEERRSYYDTPDKDATDERVFERAGREYGAAWRELERRGKSR